MSWWRDSKRVLGWTPFAKVYLVRIVFIVVGYETPRMEHMMVRGPISVSVASIAGKLLPVPSTRWFHSGWQ